MSAIFRRSKSTTSCETFAEFKGYPPLSRSRRCAWRFLLEHTSISSTGEQTCVSSLHSHSRQPNARAHLCPHRSAVGCELAVFADHARTGEIIRACPYPACPMQVVMLALAIGHAHIRRKRLAREKPGGRRAACSAPSPTRPFRREPKRLRRSRAHRTLSADRFSGQWVQRSTEYSCPLSEGREGGAFCSSSLASFRLRSYALCPHDSMVEKTLKSHLNIEKKSAPSSRGALRERVFLIPKWCELKGMV